MNINSDQYYLEHANKLVKFSPSHVDILIKPSKAAAEYYDFSIKEEIDSTTIKYTNEKGEEICRVLLKR